jgi:hypothetical protein
VFLAVRRDEVSWEPSLGGGKGSSVGEESATVEMSREDWKEQHSYRDDLISS